MLKVVRNTDLYDPVNGIYLFCYNDVGSICEYDVDREEALELAALADSASEYWGSLLGPGGHIYDDPSYEYYEDCQVSNHDYCDEYYKADWYSCDEWYAANRTAMAIA